MKSLEELKYLFEIQLKPALISLETLRKKLMSKYILYILGLLVSFAIPFFFGQQMHALMYVGIGGALLFIFLLVMLNGQKKIYRAEFKQKVVKEIVNLINPEWNYQPDGRISEMDYQKSDLFNTHYDRYKGDDRVFGSIEKTDFEFSELHTEYKTTTTKDGKTEEHWHTIFKGIFAHADFNKEIKGKTLVLPDTAEKLFGGFGKKLQSMSSRGKLIKMENVEFEKMFVVYGSDQIESRYILTPTMMEALINIRKTYGKNVYFSFIGSRVYFAISFNKDLFEPRIFKSGVRFEDVQQMNDQISIIQTLVHELNLNTRIWTKN
jgi:hypothetical protein